MSRKPRVDRTPEEKWQSVQEVERGPYAPEVEYQSHRAYIFGASRRCENERRPHSTANADSHEWPYHQGPQRNSRSLTCQRRDSA